MPRLTVTVSEALVEKLSRMSEHYGVTVSRFVIHACDSTLHEGVPLSLSPAVKVSQSVPSTSNPGDSLFRAGAPRLNPDVDLMTPSGKRRVDRVTFRMPICAERTMDVKEEEIGPGDMHIGCPGRT